MNLILAWVAAPLLWCALSLGIGLLVQRLVAGRLPGGLIAPIGFAGLVVLGTLTTKLTVTAILTMPVAVVLAALGFYLGRAEIHRPRPAVPALIAAVVVYALYILPVVVSGAPFAGWIKLDDGATWLAFSDQLATAGRTTLGLNPSSYEAVLQINWDSANAGGAYPIGVFPPLGGMASLLKVDAAWLLQPYLAFLAGLLALSIYTMLRDVAPTALRTGLTVLASTPALLVGYAFWGGIKEMALAPLFILVAILAVRRLSTVALAVATAAVLLVAGFSGGMWIAVPLLVWLVLTVRARAWRSVALMVLGTLAMSAPALVALSPRAVSSLLGFASGSADIGNLTGPLNRLQVLGIWPVGDFRTTPQMAPVAVLLVVVMGLAGIGLWAAGRERRWELPVYVGNVLLIAMVFAGGNAWIGGKALAMASPAPLVAAAAGIGWLWSQRRVVEACVGLGLVATGVVWSYALAYHDVWLAPAAQLQELQAIGEDQSLPAPALMLEYSPYGVRHFLRELDAEGAGELRRRTISTVDGGTVDKAAYADIDEITQVALADFPTLVLRRSPIASRPPSDYRLAWSGEFYDVWERDSGTTVVSHTPFGDSVDPARTPKCLTVEQVAATAAPGDRLAYVERPPLVVVPLGPDGAIVPTAGMRITETFEVADAGDYQVALGGSFTGEVTLGIDGEQIWQGRHQLNWTGNTTPAGLVTLSPGQHELTLDYSASVLQPGSGGGPWPLGPVYLSLAGAEVRFIDPFDAREICGKRLDWLEVVR